MKHLISLSPTSLSLFLECPRCFWLQVNRSVRRPFVPFPSLPGGIEEKVKAYFDQYRQQGGLPPEIRGKIDGVLFPNERLLTQWRDWRRGITFYDKGLNARLVGAIDDLLIQSDRYAPLDYKSRGSAPTPDSAKYYQNQLDCYAFLLEKNGYRTSGKGYLLFYHPSCIQKGSVVLEFTPVEVEISLERVQQCFYDATSILRSGIPAPGPGCGFCAWVNQVRLQNFAASL